MRQGNDGGDQLEFPSWDELKNKVSDTANVPEQFKALADTLRRNFEISTLKSGSALGIMTAIRASVSDDKTKLLPEYKVQLPALFAWLIPDESARKAFQNMWERSWGND